MEISFDSFWVKYLIPFCLLYSPGQNLSFNSLETINTGSLCLKSLSYSFVVPSNITSGALNVKRPKPFIKVPLPL